MPPRHMRWATPAVRRGSWSWWSTDRSERQHGLDRLARAHVPHRLVDVREGIGADQAVQWEAPLLDQTDQGGDEALGLGVAEGEADDPLAAEEPVDVEGDLGAERRGRPHGPRAAGAPRGGAPDDPRAAGAERVDALAQDVHVARGLHDAVRALTAGEGGERLAEVLLGRVDRVSGAQLPCQGEAFTEPVDGDDRRGGAEGGGPDGGGGGRPRAAADRRGSGGRPPGGSHGAPAPLDP